MKTFKITRSDFLKGNRIGSRQAELEDSSGWTAKHKVHKSKKSYSRKNFKIEVE